MATVAHTQKLRLSLLDPESDLTHRLKVQKARQRAFIAAYKAGLFNVSKACKQIGISRRGFYYWKNDADGAAEFRETLEDAEEEIKDMIEEKLLKRVREGDTKAIIFAAKTRLRDRGYVE